MRRGRGRPKVLKLKKDFGTPELVKKRLMDITTEPLDLCLKQEIIDKEQHAYGIRFRWLYTLKFGLPSAKAYDPARSFGREIDKYTDQAWLQKRQKEYTDIVTRLEIIDALKVVKDVCIYNVMPIFLIEPNLDSLKELYKLQEGLSLLMKEG